MSEIDAVAQRGAEAAAEKHDQRNPWAAPSWAQGNKKPPCGGADRIPPPMLRGRSHQPLRAVIGGPHPHRPCTLAARRKIVNDPHRWPRFCRDFGVNCVAQPMGGVRADSENRSRTGAAVRRVQARRPRHHRHAARLPGARRLWRGARQRRDAASRPPVGPIGEVLAAARARRHAGDPHPRGAPARSARCAAPQGRARRPGDAHRRARADGPHPDSRRTGARHHPGALPDRTASR